MCGHPINVFGLCIGPLGTFNLLETTKEHRQVLDVLMSSTPHFPPLAIVFLAYLGT